MDAFMIIEMVEGKKSADAFKKYFDALDLKPEIREKISDWNPEHPLYHNGFHPALTLHMLEYNKQFAN